MERGRIALLCTRRWVVRSSFSSSVLCGILSVTIAGAAAVVLIIVAEVGLALLVVLTNDAAVLYPRRSKVLSPRSVVHSHLWSPVPPGHLLPHRIPTIIAL